MLDDIGHPQNPSENQIQHLIKLYNQDQLGEVFEQTSTLTKQYPNSLVLWNLSGASAAQIGKLDEAIDAFKKAISIKPDYADAYNNMGNALKGQGKLEEAIEAYDKVLSIKPDTEAYYNMGNALKEQRKLEEAVEAFKKAISIKPDYAAAYNNMGTTLKDQGKPDEAIEAYKKAISIKPDYAEAYNNIGNTLIAEGKLEEAAEAYNKAIAIKPDYGSAKHMLSALSGTTPKTAPREYVEELFDDYSEKFEDSLVNKLEYKTPKLIRNILIKSDSNKSLGSILDLGCGTGLFGLEIKDHCSKLEGIDLSNKMLSVAKQKNVYDTLSQSDIVEYLSTKPLDFEYYVAADVFVYVGDLSEIFRLIKSRNRKSGKLVFSTEHSEVDGYHILESGRYSHSKTYIESLCKEFDYKIVHFSTADLRKEKGDFLTGGIYILEFENET